jgi:hypothetical protein
MKISEAKHPQGVCACAHVGDGPGSAHGGILGHGPCSHCDCMKFTWVKFTPYGQSRIQELRAKRK